MLCGGVVKSKAAGLEVFLSKLCQLPRFWESKAGSRQQHSLLQHKASISEDKQVICILFHSYSIMLSSQM